MNYIIRFTSFLSSIRKEKKKKQVKIQSPLRHTLFTIFYANAMTNFLEKGSLDLSPIHVLSMCLPIVCKYKAQGNLQVKTLL